MKLLDAIADYLDKARSRVYGIFIFWLLALHTPVIFTSLFVSQEIIYKETDLLKNEYIKRTFFNFSEWWMWPLYVIFVFAFSAAMTWLMIWVLPRKVVKFAYGRELEDQYEREFMKITEDERLNDKKAALINEQKKVIAEEEKVVQRQNNLEAKEESVWLKQYEQFKKSALYKDFFLIPNSIYEHRGMISHKDSYLGVDFEIPTDLVSYAHGSGLITVDVVNQTIDLTEKGKFFVMTYQVDNK